MYDKLLTYIRRKYLFLFVLTFLSTIFSALLVRNSGGVSGVLIITFSMIPLIEILNKFFEKEIIKVSTNPTVNVLIRHKELIYAYFSIFFSAVLATYISYLLFPQIFNEQVKAIYDIKMEITMYGYSIKRDAFFSYILINNLKVLMMFFIFSIIFGAGSLYLLLWNSSIIGVFLGMKAMEYSGNPIMKYVFYPFFSFIKILPHGILEFLGYFLASLSGAMLAMSLLIKDRDSLQQIISDSLLLFLFSILFIVMGAFVEAFL